MERKRIFHQKKKKEEMEDLRRNQRRNISTVTNGQDLRMGV